MITLFALALLSCDWALGVPSTNSLNQASYYVAAIAEHAVAYGNEKNRSYSPEELKALNLDLYVRHIKLAREKNAQVIVFPEFGLTATQSDNITRSDLYPYAEPIPEASEKIIPCGNKSFPSTSIVYRMSCAARDYQILVLVNTIDWVDCDQESDNNCPSDHHYQYNTDILFDEQGMIVAKYQKSHEWPPFIGPYNQAPAPTQITYQSSFGVQFGLFICFDIVFPDPAKELRAQGISHFLYAVAQGEVGLKTLITEWSHAQEATLLAANLGAGNRLGGGDCSGFVVNGTLLETEKIYLGKDYPEENVIIASIPFSN